MVTQKDSKKSRSLSDSFIFGNTTKQHRFPHLLEFPHKNCVFIQGIFDSMKSFTTRLFFSNIDHLLLLLFTVINLYSSTYITNTNSVPRRSQENGKNKIKRSHTSKVQCYILF